MVFGYAPPELSGSRSPVEAVIFHSLVFYIERLPQVGAQKFPYSLHLRRSMLISFKAETAKAGDLHPEVGRSESANENAHRARLGGNTEVDGEGGVA